MTSWVIKKRRVKEKKREREGESNHDGDLILYSTLSTNSPHLGSLCQLNSTQQTSFSLSDTLHSWPPLPLPQLKLLSSREGNGTPLQYSCLENPMDGGPWWAAVHGVTKNRTQLSVFIFTFHFHALEKEMATHSSVLAWRIPGKGEPVGLLSMGSHRVGHDWSDLAAAAAETTWVVFSHQPSAKSCYISLHIILWTIFHHQSFPVWVLSIFSPDALFSPQQHTVAISTLFFET